MRIKAIMLRILIQLRHDKRTVALMILAPIFVLTLMSLVFNGSDYHPKIGYINAPNHFIEQLEANDAKVIRYTEEEADSVINMSEADAVINFENGVPHIKLEGSDPSKSKAVLALVQKAMQQAVPAVSPDITYIYGYENMSAFDTFGPILIGFFVFFFVFLISSFSFLSERLSGTLERLLSMPLHRWEIVLGYVFGFGFFTILQSTLIAWYSINVLNIMMKGSFALVLLITILLAMVALSLGLLISGFADNELQVLQFIPIILVPQIFFSGMFDLSTMSPWLQAIGRIMPLWYAAEALKNIMIRGRGLSDIAFNASILLAICILFILINILVLKKYRKI